MADSIKEPARDSSLTITDCMMRAMSDFGEKDYVRCVVIAMNDDGSERSLYSNARSEPEMFGMIEMAREGFTDNIIDDEEADQ
jgi:hypothetical protein